MLKFSKDHEWLRIDGDVATIGITSYAEQQLGDVVFVELPEPGRLVKQGAAVAVVESVKAATEIYAPVGGEITEVNEAIAKAPALVNKDPMGSAWFFKMKIGAQAQLDTLLSEDAYKELVG
jgi:glycine cleavage system H protein